MAVSRRWYLAKILRGSTVANAKNRRGFVPSVVNYVPFSAPGRWWGFAPVEALGLGVLAVTWDNAIMDPAEVVLEKQALIDAPDNRLFDLRAAFTSTSQQWTRFEKFKTALEAVHVDASRIGPQTHSVKRVFREAVRHFLLYARLGPVVPQRGLDETQATMPKLFRDAFHNRLLEMGVPSARLGSGTTNFRTVYRGILSAGFAPELDNGKFHLGRRDTNLGGSAEGVNLG